jgi:secreted trypsin-like serine protease
MQFHLCYLVGLFSLIQNAYQATYLCDADAPCGCSQNSVTSNARIVNGEEAGLHTWSWAVSLNVDGGICGGTIIDPYFVVTAAHCLDPTTQPRDITIYAGTLIIDQGITRTASRIYSHSDYNARLHTNDIALLKVDKPFDLSSVELAEICLPGVFSSTEEYPAPDTSLLTVGWGTLYEGAASASRALQQVTVQAVGSEVSYCQGVIKDPTLQFCAGTMPQGGKGEHFLPFLFSMRIDQNALFFIPVHFVDR